MIHSKNIYCLNWQWKTFVNLNIYVSALDKFALRKKERSRGNSMALMNQTLKNIQIKRGRLINSYLNKSVEHQTAYSRQRNYCISLLRQTKK